jgi:hypothetical protein
MTTKPTLTAERLRELLHYDPKTGVFTWLYIPGRPNKMAGKVAGRLKDNGYIGICVDGTQQYAHRLAVLYMTGSWPIEEVDHRDRDRANNAWSNLREASRVENATNTKFRAHNTSGARGVSWHSQRRKWRAGITIDGRNFHLGLFDTVAEASAAYQVAASQHHSSFRAAA